MPPIRCGKDVHVIMISYLLKGGFGINHYQKDLVWTDKLLITFSDLACINYNDAIG